MEELLLHKYLHPALFTDPHRMGGCHFVFHTCVSQTLDMLFVHLRCLALVSFTLLLQMLIDLPVQILHGFGSSLCALQGLLNPQLKLLISLHIHVTCLKHLAFVKDRK